MTAKIPTSMWPTLLVVGGVTFCFVAVIVASILTGREVDAELYGLMGIVAGGVLGYGVLKK